MSSGMAPQQRSRLRRAAATLRQVLLRSKPPQPRSPWHEVLKDRPTQRNQCRPPDCLLDHGGSVVQGDA